MLRAARLQRASFPDRSKAEVEERLEAMTEANWPAEAVRKASEEAEMAGYPLILLNPPPASSVYLVPTFG